MVKISVLSTRMKTVGILNGNMFYHFETQNPIPETEIEGNCIVENLYYDQKSCIYMNSAQKVV